MNHPEITVVIPLYNKAPYIKRAIDSILAQTINDFEIIVVNDGSIDRGKNVEQYTDSRIHLINQNNQGVSVAKNNGVNAERTELIAFLDADDEYLPEYLETILRLRENWPGAGTYGTAGYSCSLSNNMVKSNRLSNYDNNWGEDTDLFARICLNYKYIYSAKCLTRYYVDIVDSITKDKTPIFEHPFQITIRALPQDYLSSHPQCHGLTQFIDLLILYLASRFVGVNWRCV